MKLLKITTFYPSYLKKFYSQHPGLSNKTYREQKAALDYDLFAWADYWSHALTPLGYEVLKVVLNVESMQRAWALENSLPSPETISLKEIALAQVKKFKPEVLWFCNYDEELLREIRLEVPSIKLVLGWVGSALPQTKVWQQMDLVLSCAPESVERLKNAGFPALHLHHGFDSRVNERLINREKRIDFSFIGQLVRASEFHLDREQLLEQLAAQIGIDIFSPSADLGLIDDVKSFLMMGLYESVQAMRVVGIPERFINSLPLFGRASKWQTPPLRPVNTSLRPFIKSAVFGLEMFQVLRDSKLVLNIHAGSSPLFASNLRLFETTGIGSCMVTDWKENLHELFDLDKEIVAYKTADECVEKVRWLIEHPKEREAIAAAGQKRCLRDHSFAQRALELDKIIKREFS